ncbi:hypothetical protein EDB81DRAFT_901722 [Dactylonectria macrodidyma]|uniref:Uncharacterized protein n=1 Tax=Dactylonectria macrodidyma TaxID=307937 RepID=A0A9P9EIT8_9HYPO|nr:hypothetical protein EDB81DRAFT_901722 [Dactylonectria macrodidyma]
MLILTSSASSSATAPPALSNLELSRSEILGSFAEVKMLCDQRLAEYQIDNIDHVVLAAPNRLCIALVVEVFEELGCPVRSATAGQVLERTRRSASASTEPEPLIGFPSSRLCFLPKEIFGIETRVFDHEAAQPDANPDLTVWALMNALKHCSTRVLPILELNKPARELELRSRQNCDAMIRHLMGDEREAQDCCTRCAQKKGALIGCIVAEGSTICGNCDWNRSGLGCSLASRSESPKLSTKRKAVESDDSEDGRDLFDELEPDEKDAFREVMKIFTRALKRRSKRARQSRSSRNK